MMERRNIFRAKCAAAVLAVPLIIWAHASGPEPARTGAPGEKTCRDSGCHLGTPAAGGSVTITYSGGANYTPGQRGKFTVTITDPTARVYGFQATAKLASNRTAGRMIPGTSQFVQCETGLDRDPPNAPSRTCAQNEYIQHSAPFSSKTIEFEWNPPATDAGEIKVYVAGNAANGNGQADAGDHIYTGNLTLTVAAATTNKPAISDGGVADAFTFQRGVAANSWTSIFGTNLSTTTRNWDGSPEFAQGKLPLSLDGVSVTINGKPAPVFFISPGQVNVLAPTDDATGNVQVVLKNAAGESAPLTISKSAVLPAFYAPFGSGGKLFVTSVENSTGAILGKPGVEPRAQRGVRPNDVVQFYTTGLGPTNPVVQADTVVTGAPAFVNTPTIKINNVDVPILGSALVGSGLYQINARIPATLTAGDFPIVLTVAGKPSADNVLITVQQ